MQSKQKVLEAPSQPIGGHGMHLSPSYGGKYKITRLQPRPAWAKRVRPYFKNNQRKTGWKLGSRGRVSA
jgi:hypothetical protein